MPRRPNKEPSAPQEPARAHITSFKERDEYIRRVLASDLSSPAKVIVSCLAFHLNIENGRLQVSADTLAGESRFSVRHVLRMLQEAEAAEWLGIARELGIANRFTLTEPHSPTSDKAVTGTHDKAVTGDRVGTRDKAVTGDRVGTRDKAVTRPVTNRARTSDTVVTQKAEQRLNSGGDISGPVFSSGEEADRESRKPVLPVGSPADRATPDAGKADEVAAQFSRFWSAFPRKVNKAKAAKAFGALSASERLEVLDEVKRYGEHRRQVVADDPAQSTFTLHAATYLTDQRWREEAQEYSSEGGPTLDGMTSEPVPVSPRRPFNGHGRTVTDEEMFAHVRKTLRF